MTSLEHIYFFMKNTMHNFRPDLCEALLFSKIVPYFSRLLITQVNASLSADECQTIIGHFIKS